MPSVRATGEYQTFDIGVGLPLSGTLSTLVDLADQGCFLRLELAPDTMNDEEEEYTVIWARDFPVLKSSYPRWLQQELASMKRAAKKNANPPGYASALLLGLYNMKSTLGKVERFRYLCPEALDHPPQPYPQKSTWDPDAWVPYDPEFLAELAEKQHLESKDRWLGPALRRAGTSVQWLTASHATFVSQEEYDVLNLEPRIEKYPDSVQLIHPTEGRIYVYILPRGRVVTVEFENRAFERSCWEYESAQDLHTPPIEDNCVTSMT